MGIVRILIFLGIALFVVRIVWRLVRSAPPSETMEGQGGGKDAPSSGQADSLLRCSRCGTLIPQDLLLRHEDRSYCSPRCRDGVPPGQA